MIIGIVGVFFIIRTTQSIHDKVGDLHSKADVTVGKLYDSVSNIGDMGSNIGSFVSQFTFLKPKQSGILEIIRKILS
jgi:hypothetical protein